MVSSFGLGACWPWRLGKKKWRNAWSILQCRFWYLSHPLIPSTDEQGSLLKLIPGHLPGGQQLLHCHHAKMPIPNRIRCSSCFTASGINMLLEMLWFCLTKQKECLSFRGCTITISGVLYKIRVVGHNTLFRVRAHHPSHFSTNYSWLNRVAKQKQTNMT